MSAIFDPAGQAQLQRLPRLLYIGDVPVEDSYHGSALLYRLLQTYPRERLFIVEGSLLASQIKRRLAGARYAALPVGSNRLLHTRLSTLYSSWLTLTTVNRTSQIDRLCRSFEAAAVLTVAHGYIWTTAARFAAERGLPLHLICHDDHPRVADVITFMTEKLDARFASVYRQATSRLCISPYMRDAYRKRYKADGTVLYPSRRADCPVYQEPPYRLYEVPDGLTVAFGGTINSTGYLRALKSLARILEVIKGRLLIFGPVRSADVRDKGLDRSNIELRGLLDSRELIRQFRNEADVLFVPMSFDAAHRTNMEIGFPSKLADYTAVGIPLLIYGPEYSSAVRWARQNPGVAEVVSEENTRQLEKAIHGLAANPARRVELGARALEAGRYFGFETAQEIFYRALLAGASEPADQVL